MTECQRVGNVADAYCDVPEVLQDKQEPLRIGRFLLSKKHFFASTTETLLCHAFMAVLVVPKGCTIDQVCGPRESYRVLKRFPLQCLPMPNANSDGANPLRKMNNPAGIALQESNAGQPAVLSYVDGQVAGKRIQPPAVIISPTAPWSRAAVKGNEDTVMHEASNLCLHKPISKNDTDTALKEPDDVEMGERESGIPHYSSCHLSSQSPQTDIFASG